MQGDSLQPGDTARIDTSFAEIHALISALETQLKSGLASPQFDVYSVENSMPKVISNDRDELVFDLDR